MTARARLGRGAAMDAQELRSRLTCAVRTCAGRARFAVSPPRWKREHLLAILDPESAPLVGEAVAALRRRDPPAAPRAFARHVEARASRPAPQASPPIQTSAPDRPAFPQPPAPMRG